MIYELNDGDLKLAVFDHRSKERPADFDTSKDKIHVIYMKRVR